MGCQEFLIDGGLPSTVQGAGFVCTVLEPAKYARHRDLLADRLGPKNWPPTAENKGAVSHCFCFHIPFRVLEWDGERGRHDRLVCLEDRLWDMLNEKRDTRGSWFVRRLSTLSSGAEQQVRTKQKQQRKHHFLASLCGTDQQRLEDMLAHNKLAKFRDETLSAARRPDGSLRLTDSPPSSPKKGRGGGSSNGSTSSEGSDDYLEDEEEEEEYEDDEEEEASE